MPAVLACPACRTQPMSRRGDPLCPVCAQQARETVPWPLWLGLTIIYDHMSFLNRDIRGEVVPLE